MKTRTPLAERFWSKVDKSGDCWLWTGATTFGGYGVIQRGGADGGLIRAHRYAYEEQLGPIPKGQGLCHRCDMPGCVRPTHLFPGDQRTNMADCAAKGRTRPGGQTGVAHHRAKLNPEKVVQIRQLRRQGLSLNAVAERFDVSKKTILNIDKGVIWREVA